MIALRRTNQHFKGQFFVWFWYFIGIYTRKGVNVFCEPTAKKTKSKLIPSVKKQYQNSKRDQREKTGRT